MTRSLRWSLNHIAQALGFAETVEHAGMYWFLALPDGNEIDLGQSAPTAIVKLAEMHETKTRKGESNVHSR